MKVLEVLKYVVFAIILVTALYALLTMTVAFIKGVPWGEELALWEKAISDFFVRLF
ncbi:MAG: hypothetical protein IKW33_02675 [Clostridia bacterium]|nr:hypothetical protein [Clostridia bacterium]